MRKPPTVSVVVPVYNSQDTLTPLVERLEAVLPQCCARWEIILVNDGSRDRSWETIQALEADHDQVCGINLMRNYGQHNALLCGIRAARHGVIVTLDDDLQHPPEETPLLLDRLAGGYDVVYGTPQREQHGFARDLASRITKLALESAMGAETARKVSAFRAFRTPLRAAFDRYRSPYVSIDVLLTWGTTRFAAVPVRHEPRRVGASNYTFLKLVVHALTVMTGFSTLPLRLASIIGLSFTVFGLGILLYVLGAFLVQGRGVPGFPFLASIIAIFSGVQLFSLGIMGEYIARIFNRSMERPPYVVGVTQDEDEGEPDHEPASWGCGDRAGHTGTRAQHAPLDV